jgi:AcrR family transcriptional regulator
MGKTKNNLRNVILETARQLFNQRGYNGVSMRDISKALGISVGNLTYYYGKKEELAEAVTLFQHAGYRKPESPQTLEGLHECFKRVLAHQSGNPYYSRHYKQLAQISPQIRGIQETVLHDLRDLIKDAFSHFKLAGLLEAEIFENQDEYLIETILTLCAYGTVLERTNPLSCVWGLIYPMLTASGKKIYRERIEIDCQLKPAGESSEGPPII